MATTAYITDNLYLNPDSVESVSSQEPDNIVIRTNSGHTYLVNDEYNTRTNLEKANILPIGD
jgi:hypothetical protein